MTSRGVCVCFFLAALASASSTQSAVNVDLLGDLPKSDGMSFLQQSLEFQQPAVEEERVTGPVRAGADDRRTITRMSCGALVFLHIGKTGGTTIKQFLKLQAPQANFTFYDVWTDGPGSPWGKNARMSGAAKAARQRTDSNNLVAYNYSEDQEWVAFKRQAYTLEQPMLALHIHHGVPGVGRYLWDNELAPMHQMLQGKGCELRFTTVLRDGVGRARSGLMYHQDSMNHSWKTDTYDTCSDGVDDACACEYARSNSNVQAAYILFGHLSSNSIWSTAVDTDNSQNPLADIADGDEDSNMFWAMQASLVVNQTAYMVGSTDLLDDFMAGIQIILGLPVDVPMMHARSTKHSTDLSETAESCIRDASVADTVLYDLYFGRP